MVNSRKKKINERLVDELFSLLSLACLNQRISYHSFIHSFNVMQMEFLHFFAVVVFFAYSANK